MQPFEEIFPTIIYRGYYNKVDNLHDNLFAKLDTVFTKTENNNNVFMKQGTLCSYHSEPDLHIQYPDETKEVVDFVEECSEQYWQKCGYHSELEPFVFQMWANKTPKGGYIDSHLHGNMPFTAVLYVDASPAQGNLVLENPLEMVLMTQPISPDIKYPIETEISVKNGDLIIFPGYLRHSVKPNEIEKPRLILAFNIGCRGRYWSGQWTFKNA